MKTITLGDFIELSYTGYVNGNVFDSNREDDVKKLDSEAKPRKMFIIVGQNMVVKGLDKALEGKEIGTEYAISLAPEEAFGKRNPSLIRPLPLKAFTEKKVFPQAGMTLVLDNSLVSIRAVSGARVITDFNNPLAGKNIEYSFAIKEKIDDIAHK